MGDCIPVAPRRLSAVPIPLPPKKQFVVRTTIPKMSRRETKASSQRPYREFNYLQELRSRTESSPLIKTTNKLSQNVQLESTFKFTYACTPMEAVYWRNLKFKTYVAELQTFFSSDQGQNAMIPQTSQNILLLKIKNNSIVSSQKHPLSQFQSLYHTLSDSYNQQVFTTTVYSGSVFYKNNRPNHQLLELFFRREEVKQTANTAEGDQSQLKQLQEQKDKTIEQQFYLAIYHSFTLLHKPTTQPFNSLFTYFEIQNYILQHMGGFFWISSNHFLSAPTNCFLSYSIIQCLLYMMNATASITKIQKFLTLDTSLLLEIRRILTIALLFQDCPVQQLDNTIHKCISMIYLQIDTIADGLFLELGFQINEKQHPFRNDPLCLVSTPISLKYMVKHQQHAIDAYPIIKQLHHLTAEGLSTPLPTLHTNGRMQRDFQMRVSLLRAMKCMVEQPTKARALVAETIGKLTAEVYVTGELAQGAFTLQAILSEGQQNGQWYYLRALELCHRMLGDPRTCRHSHKPPQQWQKMIIQYYKTFLEKQGNRKCANTLNNVLECLNEDLREGGQVCIFMHHWGVYYQQAELWDDGEDCRSVYSELCEKRSKFEVEFLAGEWSLRSEEYKGVVHWGQSVNCGPTIYAPLKNRVVLGMASGSYHTVVLTEEGVWVDRNGGKGRLEIMLLVQIRRGRDKYQLSCGNEHTAFLLNGLLRMWGTQGLAAGHLFRFDQVCCGGLHTLGILDGVVYSWGRGQGGQLGHPIDRLQRRPREETTEFYLDTPTALGLVGAVKVVCGDAHSMVLTNAGEVYVFGFSYQGQLGLGLTGQSETYQVFQPVKLDCLPKISNIFGGPTFSFFCTRDNQVYSCGLNDFLQLGIERMVKVLVKKRFLERPYVRKIGQPQFSVPRKIAIFSLESKLGLRVTHIECGENHCVANALYNEEEIVVGWGLNRQYQLGSEFMDITAPRTLDALTSLKVEKLCCASNKTYAILCWPKVTCNQLSILIQEKLKKNQKRI